MKILLFILVLLFSQLGFSTILSHVVVEGIILGYDDKTVTLSQRGQKTTVPRESIPSHFKIEVGKKVQAVFDRKKVMEDLKKSQKTQQQKTGSKKKPL